MATLNSKWVGRCKPTACHTGESTSISVNNLSDNTRTSYCIIKGKIIKMMMVLENKRMIQSDWDTGVCRPVAPELHLEGLYSVKAVQ